MTLMSGTNPNNPSLDIQGLTTKAFVLEALTDKPGCTTRYIDQPGKPLTDFMIAGINSAPFLQRLADDYSNNPNCDVFAHFPDALRASNQHKSPKYVNFGLLEIMFPTVYARLQQSDPHTVIPSIHKALQKRSQNDVQSLLEARRIAFSTSSSPHKQNFPFERYTGLNSAAELYAKIKLDQPNDKAGHQWSAHYESGLPFLKYFFDSYMERGEIVQTTAQTYAELRAQHPNAKLGILADMSAAAIFLWLSYNGRNVQAV